MNAQARLRTLVSSMGLLATLLASSVTDAQERVVDYCGPGGNCYRYLKYDRWEENPVDHYWEHLYFCKYLVEASHYTIYFSPEGLTRRPNNITKEELESATTSAFAAWRYAADLTCMSPALVSYGPADSVGSTTYPTISVTFIDANWVFGDLPVGVCIPELVQDDSRTYRASIYLRSEAGYNWTINTGPYELQTVLTHELGHALGMDHPPAIASCRDEVMYKSLSGNSQHQLGPGETSGIDQLWECASAVLGSFRATAAPALIELTWEDDDITQTQPFVIKRAYHCGGPYTPWATVPRTGATTYGLTDWYELQERRYWYKLEDYNGEQYASAECSGCEELEDDREPRNLLVELRATGTESEAAILRWTPPVRTGVVEYQVHRQVDGVNLDCDTYVGATTDTTFVDAVISGGVHSYVVLARIDELQQEKVGESEPVVLCVPARMTVDAERKTLCPGGDGDAISIASEVYPACGVSASLTREDLYAVRSQAPGSEITLWDSATRQVLGDTVYASTYDSEAGVATWNVAHGRGAGVESWQCFAGAVALSTPFEVSVRSFDQNDLAVGAVDRLDWAEASTASLNGNPGSWDLDWSGGAVGVPDVALLASHFFGRHAATRKLLSPNEGEAYGPGNVVPIAWIAAGGDSARVTLRAIQSSSTDTTVVVSDTLDTGTYNWTVPATNKAGAGWRMQVLHSAGYYKVDYRDVGTDMSDTAFTLRPNAVSNLSAMVGRHTAALSWSDPIQGTVTADAHVIRYKVNTPITEANFDGADSVASPPAPYTSGTQHCFEWNGLFCGTFYFAMKTKDRGTWSKMSNVAVATAPCSGFNEVLCEGGLLTGGGEGGGGEEESSRPMALTSAGFGTATLDSGTEAENSVLGGVPEGAVEDLFRLPRSETELRAAPRIVLREASARQVEVDAVGLGTVDHANGTEAIAGLSSVMIGPVSPVGSALDGNGTSVADALNPTVGPGITMRGGDALTVQLGSDTRSAALVLESRGRVGGVRNDSLGILVQKPNRVGGWDTITRIIPRRGFDRHAVAIGGSGEIRLVFMKEYDLRSLGRLNVMASVTPEPLSVTSATHSRLGAVEGAVEERGGAKTTLDSGDSLSISFVPREAASGTNRSYFLTIRGSLLARNAQGTSSEAALLASAGTAAPEFGLGPARPNPSTGSTVIVYSLATAVPTELAIYDVTGRRVRTLVSAEQPAGVYENVWDGRDEGGRAVSAGVYFYRLSAGHWQSERKLIVIQ